MLKQFMKIFARISRHSSRNSDHYLSYTIHKHYRLQTQSLYKRY